MSHRREALAITPPLLIATTWAVFQRCTHLLGPRVGYFVGFLFYWGVWCVAVPLALVGRRRLQALWQRPTVSLQRQGAAVQLWLAVPVCLVYTYEFPCVVGSPTLRIVLASAAIALVNGTLEEVLWRGVFLEVFPRSWIGGYAYPSVAFALWHLAPQSVFPNRAPGGRMSLVAVSLALGLVWGHVARRTGSIRWTCIAHVLFDFSGLGGRFYVRT